MNIFQFTKNPALEKIGPNLKETSKNFVFFNINLTIFIKNLNELYQFLTKYELHFILFSFIKFWLKTSLEDLGAAT